MKELLQFEKNEIETTQWIAVLLTETDHMRITINGQYYRITDSNAPIAFCNHCGWN